MKRLFPFILLFTIIISFHCQKKPDQKVLAEGKYKLLITENDFIKYYNKLYPGYDYEKVDIDSKRKLFNEILKNQLLLIEAKRLGLDKEDEIKKSTEQIEKQLASEEFKKREIDNKIFTDALYKKYYEWSKDKLILLRMKFYVDSNGDNKKEKEDKAKNILAKLDNGEDFKKLAAQYSEHKYANQDSGYMGLSDCFNTKDYVYEKAYNLSEGQISNIFFANNAFFIVKLEKRIPQPIGSFQDEKENLKENIERISKKQRHDLFQELVKNLQKEYNLEFISKNIEFFCKRCEKLTAKQDSAGLFTIEEKQLPLTKSKIEEISVGFFFNEAFPYYWKSLSNPKFVNMILEEMNHNRIMRDKAIKEGLQKEPQVKKELENWLNRRLKDVIIQREIFDKVNLSDEQYLQSYTQNQRQYIKPKMMVVQEIFRKTKEDIDKVYRLAVKGHNFTNLVKEYCQYKGRNKDGSIGPFSSNQNGNLGKTADKMKIGETSDPFKYRGGYSIIKLISIDPERLQGLDEVKEQVRNDYLSKNSEMLIDKWYQKAKEEYKIKIYL